MVKLFSTIVCALIAFNSSGQDTRITITSKPEVIFIEQGTDKQIINFDFLVSNRSSDTFSLDKLSVSVYNEENNLIQERFLDNNGTAPSILLLPKRLWNGISNHLLFNPFHEFQIQSPIHRLDYEWTFSNNKKEQIISSSSVYPKKFQQKQKLELPVKGRILVYDAHDYTSHHRRFDFNFAPINELGLVTNFMRYAYDFVLLDEDNRQFKNNGETDSDYYSFGSPVYAVAEGKVIYVASHHKDDKNFNVPKLKENPLELYGNCIAILHQDSSVSIYGHLKLNSIKVKVGDRVRTNQQLAQIGVSGSSFFPHLHFELRTSITNEAEGLPSYFKNIFLLEGKLKRLLKTGLVETGNIIETK